MQDYRKEILVNVSGGFSLCLHAMLFIGYDKVCGSSNTLDDDLSWWTEWIINAQHLEQLHQFFLWFLKYGAIIGYGSVLYVLDIVQEI